jgi:hypothetical protein
VSGDPLSPPSHRRAGDVAVGLVLLGYLIACAVGLPLFADGSLYLFSIATELRPTVPNLRWTATLPQLPAVTAFALGAELPLGRLIFSAGYAAVPAVSLAGCWLLVRRRQPALLLFVLLSYLALQLNFSGVSELLGALLLTWPLVLAMLVLPARRWVVAYALASGPLLLFLHPLAFLLCFGLALLAWLTGGGDDRARRIWRRVGFWLAAHGVVRLLWTAFGLNVYERGRLNAPSALNYLLAETTAQHLLLLVVAVAILLAARTLPARSAPAAGAEPPVRVAAFATGLLPVGAIWVGAEFVLGEGITLKSAATFAVGLLAMTVVSWLVLTGRAGRCVAHGVPSPAPLLCGVAVLALLLAKSTAWWTATRSLQNIVSGTDATCIAFGPQEPYGLQWPWMRIVDDWATPFTALATRPFVPNLDGRGPQPVALLLSRDGCELLRRTGEVRFTDWLSRPFESVDRAFGPLRRP